jgi:diguanylate cyclase (GGDEF)-like protein
MNRIMLLMQDGKRADQVRERLAENYQVLEVEAAQTLDFSFDLGIVDEPALSQTWKEVQLRKETAKPVFLPFLLVTARRSSDFLIYHLRRTVDEIICAPINHLELQTRVENLLRSRQLSLETQRLTMTDLLTGVHNRRFFFTIGQREINRARRLRRSLSVVMTELDHFQRLYDQFGYEAGNQILRLVAKQFLKHLRTIDVLGRYAEEKFLFLLSDTDMRGAEKVAERLRQEIFEMPFQLQPGSIPISISLGISNATGDIPTLESLVERADNALCASKQAGRNCVRLERPNSDGFDFVAPLQD